MLSKVLRVEVVIIVNAQYTILVIIIQVRRRFLQEVSPDPSMD